jgi:hypothetical protein
MATLQLVEDATIHQNDWRLSMQDKQLLSMIIDRMDKIGKELDDLKCALNVRKNKH